jgi:hypothetical protein
LAGETYVGENHQIPDGLYCCFSPRRALWRTRHGGGSAGSPEWDKTVEVAKKEGKIVIAILPAAQLRREMEVVIKQKLVLETELMPNPGPKNASRIAAEKKTGVNYFDALIVGTGTAVGLARNARATGGQIRGDDISINRA